MIHRKRKTKETEVELILNVDGHQQINIDTGHPFFNHMLHQLAWHACWDLDLKARGDLDLDDHHLVEDVALVLGAAIQEAWRARERLQRFGQRFLPMDEALVLCALDLSGRPFAKTGLKLKRKRVGKLSVEMVPHFFHSLAMAGAFTLHIRQLAGKNAHHVVEACFKALAQALREAFTPVSRESSTKGTL